MILHDTTLGYSSCSSRSYCPCFSTSSTLLKIRVIHVLHQTRELNTAEFCPFGSKEISLKKKYHLNNLNIYHLSYHHIIISYHIISYHIISYHIISYHIIILYHKHPKIYDLKISPTIPSFPCFSTHQPTNGLRLCLANLHLCRCHATGRHLGRGNHSSQGIGLMSCCYPLCFV